MGGSFGCHMTGVVGSPVPNCPRAMYALTCKQASSYCRAWPLLPLCPSFKSMRSRRTRSAATRPRIVFLEGPRNAAWLQAVAAEMNLSETAFLLRRARWPLRPALVHAGGRGHAVRPRDAGQRARAVVDRPGRRRRADRVRDAERRAHGEAGRVGREPGANGRRRDHASTCRCGRSRRRRCPSTCWRRSASSRSPCTPPARVRAASTTSSSARTRRR